MAQSGSPTPVALRAALLGVVAGMRSQMPFALLAVAARQDRVGSAVAEPTGILGSDRVLVGCGLAAAGELIGDKLPFTPSRLAPLPLAGRIGFGGAAGALLARRSGGSALLGAAAGAAGSLLGAFGGYRARVFAGRATGVADPVWGAAEDVVAVSIGLLATRR